MLYLPKNTFMSIFFKEKKKKNFLLCVGCQKGGTSWLWKQLSRNKNFYSFLKEYHVFDNLYLSQLPPHYHQKNYVKRAKTKGEGDNNLIDINNPESFTRASFFFKIENYFNYFNSVISNKKKVNTTGDFTPAYCFLSPKEFRFIKSSLEEKGFKVKVIFIMRDPVDRVLSHLRMEMRRKDIDKEFTVETLRDFYKHINCTRRTRYESIICNLEKVFEKEDIFYGFYENLFEKDSLKRFANFVEIPNLEFQIDEKVNESLETYKSSVIDPKILKKVFKYYKNTYSFCYEKFDLKSLWNKEYTK